MSHLSFVSYDFQYFLLGYSSFLANFSTFFSVMHAWANFPQADERLLSDQVLQKLLMNHWHCWLMKAARQRIAHRKWCGRNRGIYSNRCYSWAVDPGEWRHAGLQNFAASRAIVNKDRYWYWGASLYAPDTTTLILFQWYIENCQLRWRGVCGWEFPQKPPPIPIIQIKRTAIKALFQSSLKFDWYFRSRSSRCK